MNKTIAIIGPRIFPAQYEGISGLDVRVEALINELSGKKNIQVYVYVRNWAYRKMQKTIKYNNIHILPIFSINKKYLDTPIYSLIATLKLLFVKTDLIFIEGTSSGMFSFLLRLFGKNVVATIHALEWKRKKWGTLGRIILKIAEYIAIQSSNKVIAVSQELSIYIKQKYNRNSIYIPYFVTKKKNIQSQIIDKKYNLKKNEYILFLGRLVPEKRIDWIIKTFIEIKTNKKLVIAGGSGQADDYAKKLKYLAAGDKKVIFTVFVSGQEKEELISNCSLFILASEVEGLSLAFLEALGYGKKILIANGIDVDKIIKDKDSIFKIEDYTDFNQKMKKLITKNNPRPTRINLAVINSRDNFLNHYASIIKTGC